MTLPSGTFASMADYGIVGDLRSAALVSSAGSVDWLCWPRFDSPSVFARLLDRGSGGHLRVAPLGGFRSAQSYEARTNVLRTDFATPTGKASLEAFMPVEDVDGHPYGDHELRLRLVVTEGQVAAEVEFAPRFAYGVGATRLESRPHGVLALHPQGSAALSTPLGMTVHGGAARGVWSGRPGDRLGLALRHDDRHVRAYDAGEHDGKLAKTRAFWDAWCRRGSYEGPWKESVLRSAMTLRLLTYAPTGALVAAATTSLPETMGGSRNWDYRFSWIRDSSLAIGALRGLGYSREARLYVQWVRRLLRGSLDRVGDLQVCYGLEGETDLAETELPHLEGYAGSRPVRVGNGAAHQAQLDLFGSLADAIHQAYASPGGHTDEAWRGLQAIADHVAGHWQEPDHGIWEIRGPKARYTHSALMSWVALDRAMDVAMARGEPSTAERWAGPRDDIRRAILREGWSEAKGSFVQALGSEAIDASLLLIPVLGFLPGDDPRVLATLRRVEAELGEGAHVHRYRAPDGLDGREGAFLACGFWMVEALALAGRHGEAAARFEELSALAGPLGLFCEETDPATGSPLGNFPQALTHLGHIQAARALSVVRVGQPAP